MPITTAVKTITHLKLKSVRNVQKAYKEIPKLKGDSK